MEAKTAPTLEDVARHAGVSKVTVSSVVNGSRSNTRVSAITRERILSVVAELGYHPSAIARSLRAKRTNIIGYYSGYGFISLRNQFTTEIISGLQEGCEKHGKDLLLHGAFRGASVEDIYAELASGKIDGLALFAPENHPLIERLSRSHLPVVLLADGAASLPSIIADDNEGSKLVAEYLYAKNHRRILYRRLARYHAAAERRLSSLQESALRLGMTITVSVSPTDELTDEEMSILSPDNPERPTAVVCWSDDWAKSALAGCLAVGWRVPEDLAIVGFDGIEPYDPPKYRVTSVRVPWRDAGRTAIEQLIHQINGGEAPTETVLSVSLLTGDTA